MENKDGGPAFPQTIDDMGTIRSVTTGMSLRDYFAAAALTGLVGTGHGVTEEEIRADTVMRAFANADAMLAERENPR